VLVPRVARRAGLVVLAARAQFGSSFLWGAGRLLVRTWRGPVALNGQALPEQGRGLAPTGDGGNRLR